MKKIMNILFKMIFFGLLSAFIIYFTLTQPVWKPDIVNNLPHVNIQLLKADVKTLSEFLPPRTAHEKNLLATVEWLEKNFNLYGQSERQEFQVNGQTFYNVILKFNTSTVNNKTLVIGAHYDIAMSQAGADDNASGVAGLIALARLFSFNKPQSNIELVAYALEEPPYFRTKKMGSYIHAQSLKKQNKEINLMISLEMIGYFTNKADSQDFPLPFLDLFYPKEGNFIAIIGNLSNIMAVRKVKNSFYKIKTLESFSFNSPTFVSGIDYSDHRNYWQMGYPAVMVTDTAHLRNPYYHTIEDTADTLNYQKMALVIQAVYQLALDF